MKTRKNVRLVIPLNTSMLQRCECISEDGEMYAIQSDIKYLTKIKDKIDDRLGCDIPLLLVDMIFMAADTCIPSRKLYNIKRVNDNKNKRVKDNEKQ